MIEHPWPGNVRELRNRVERAVALSTAPWISVEALFPLEAVEPGEGGNSFRTLVEVRSDAERSHIRRALAGVGCVEEAAKLLGVSRSTLFQKLRKLDMRSDI